MGLLNKYPFQGIAAISKTTSFALLAITLWMTAGCGSDDGSIDLPSAPEITSISPNRGPVGTSVIIEGSGFSPIGSENTVTLSDVEAEVVASTPSSIEIFVPSGATTGPIEVTVSGTTASGPVFTVESGIPGISSISPENGPIGTEVTIFGMNFATTPAENLVTFN